MHAALRIGSRAARQDESEGQHQGRTHRHAWIQKGNSPNAVIERSRAAFMTRPPRRSEKSRTQSSSCHRPDLQRSPLVHRRTPCAARDVRSSVITRSAPLC
ncbi:hypothetical protein [Lysobacter gummosus]|uniref:hypothetical protein n=1 Tax=Lysobacter gummosus TaxID=262324 RepID=UPI003639B7C8